MSTGIGGRLYAWKGRARNGTWKTFQAPPRENWVTEETRMLLSQTERGAGSANTLGTVVGTVLK